MLLGVIAYGVFSHYLLPVANAALAVSIPVIGEMAEAVGVNPAVMVVPLAYTASCVFLVPVDPIPLTTYRYGYWKMADMMGPGLAVGVVWVGVLTAFMMGAVALGVF